MVGVIEIIAWIILASASITAVLSLVLMVVFGIQAAVRRRDPVPVYRAAFFAGIVCLDMLLILMLGSLWGDQFPLSTAIVTASFGLITLTTLSMGRDRKRRQVAEDQNDQAASGEETLRGEQ